MARIFITGSSDGLGLQAAQLLLAQGHRVVAHARNAQRATETKARLPAADEVVVGDFSSLRQTREVVAQANALGRFDAVLHNAAIGYKERSRKLTEDGLPHVFQINTLAPYVLTALMHKPQRLIYVSSELHRRGMIDLHDALWEERAWSGNRAYSETKFHDVLLAFAVARLWPDVLSNALEPGWVPTKMGGPRATGDLEEGRRTQVWLATSNDPEATVTGRYFYHLRQREPAKSTRSLALQEDLLALCAQWSGVTLDRA